MDVKIGQGVSHEVETPTGTQHIGVTFSVNVDGTVAFDASESAYVSAQGSTLTIAGFPVTTISQLSENRTQGESL